MSRRSRAREIVLQLLYQDDLNPDAAPAAKERFLRGRLRDPRLERFAADLLAGVRTKRAELDKLIASTAENWRIERMPPIDRNVLRLGAYELLFTDVPPKAAVNEAVDLAKRYGGAHSGQFVNGILDRLIPPAPPPTPATPPAGAETRPTGEPSNSTTADAEP